MKILFSRLFWQRFRPIKHLKILYFWVSAKFWLSFGKICSASAHVRLSFAKIFSVCKKYHLYKNTIDVNSVLCVSAIVKKVSWGIHILRVNDRPAIWENGLDISSTPNDKIDFYSTKTSQTHIYIQHQQLDLSNIWYSTLLENNQTIILLDYFSYSRHPWTHGRK